MVAARSTHSLLVTRACYLALRRAADPPLRPSGVVLVTEPGRALDRTDVEQVVGAPVRAEVAFDPAVARAVDAGLLASRLPPRSRAFATSCRLSPQRRPSRSGSTVACWVGPVTRVGIRTSSTGPWPGRLPCSPDPSGPGPPTG